MKPSGFKWNVDAPGWAFMWSHGTPYVCAIFGWTRKAVIADTTKMMGETWPKIYRRGGRAIKVTVSQYR